MNSSSRISKGIRAKRFRVKANASVYLIIETEMGEQIKLDVRNSSLSGIAASGDATLAENQGLAISRIIPESKISWNDTESSLGRLVVRSSRIESETRVVFGFSCIDSKVPMLGPLSKQFEVLGTGEESPLDFELSSKKFTLANFQEDDHSHVDLFNKCREYELLLQDLLKNPLFQYYAVRHEVQNLNVKMSLPRKRSPQSYINFATYDYLGLSRDPEVIDAAKRAIDRYGVSTNASPPLSGNTALHEELEARLAQLLRKEDALVFPTGFAANLGALTSLLGAGDLAVADISSHASIQDGLGGSKGKIRLYRHNGNRHMMNLLVEHRPSHAGALVVTEGLFSMDGDIPNLEEFVRIAKQYGARTFIDEAHSFGILGDKGLGAAEKCGVLDEMDVYTASLSKAMGAGGGFVAGARPVIKWMRSFARTEVFSGAVSAACAGAALKAIALFQGQPERRQKLRDNIAFFTEGLARLGYIAKSHPESPIIPVVIGDPEIMGRMNQVLIEHGIFVNPIIYPAVPVTGCRFRFSLSSVHSHSDLQLALVALKRAIEVTGFSFENVEAKSLAS